MLFRSMRVKKDRRAFRKKSSIEWADMYYGILSKDHEWSPLQRCEVFKAMSRRGSGGKFIPIVLPAEVQPVWRGWCCLIADFFLVFAIFAVSMFELLVVVSLPVIVVAGGARYILLVQDFYKDINGEAL